MIELFDEKVFSILQKEGRNMGMEPPSRALGAGWPGIAAGAEPSLRAMRGTLPSQLA